MTTHSDDGFRNLIVQTTRYTLAMVKEVGSRLSAAEQEQIKSILGYALRLERAWCDARQLLLLAAPLMEMKGERQEWIDYLEWGIAICKQRLEGDALGELQHQTGVLYCLLGQLEVAWHYAAGAVDTFATCGSPRQQAMALTERAWIEKEQGAYAKAQESVEHARTLLTAHAADAAYGLELANCDRVLGAIALNQANYASAEQYFRSALASFQQQDDQRHTAWSLNNLAYALSQQGKVQASLPYYTQAAAMMETLGDIYHWAIVRFNQGRVHTTLQQTQAALGYYGDAAAIFTQLDDKFRLSRIQTDIGLALLDLERPAHAVVAFQASVNLATALKDDSWRLNALAGLGWAYQKQKAWATAIQLFEQAMAELPRIQQAPNFAYLTQWLPQHLQAALREEA